MFRKMALPAAVFFMSTLVLSAQTDAPKYGHLNLGNLMAQLPQTKVAEDSLGVFMTQLSAKDSVMTKAFETAYLQLQKEYNEGSLTPVMLQQRQAQLEKQRQEIQEFEAKAQKDIEARRAQLLQPIYSKVEEAIKAVAQENGYLMIFDISTGAMLFAAETIDVMPLVKKKLGI